MGAVTMAALGVFAAHGEMPPYPNFGLPRVEEMMFLVLQIGIIIFAARLGGAIASFLKLPSILGELTAGIVIGPWALGGIGFGPADGLFASGLFHGGALRAMAAETGHLFDATSPALYGIATLASIILLFLSGLETNLKMFFKYSFVGSMVGVGGVVVSFLFGDLCAVYLLPYFFDSFKELATMPLAQAMTQEAPLYMGIMSTATSVGITARILSERKKMDSEEGVSIMAGAVIDDVLDYAVNNGIIKQNPVKAVYIPKHYRKNGQAFSPQKEKQFVKAIKGNKYESYYLKMLYSGVRPGEVSSIKEDVDHNTITIANGKLKHYQKKIMKKRKQKQRKNKRKINKYCV